ncbi:hypothetical protein [Rhodopirellula baltica]|uniref:Secreted protein n=1 Tax=Rhodopirellula baltica WH47 TaxID=991778 RepID=F2AUB4_RHOBT|nr:hypothetical protein [Rhodopirellula baltica]EGF26681.1 hypothetical protein RBWH47_00306 [Rhodopirellula baltica WH47]
MMKLTRMIATLCLAVGLSGLPACSQGGGDAEKLAAPEGIDWEAIEAQDGSIADAQSEGE